MDVLANQMLLNKNLDEVSGADVLKDKILVIYYFASLFEGDDALKILHQVHAKSLEKEIGVAIIFVSCDEAEDDFLEAFESHGDWYAIPYNSSLTYELIYRYGVTHIPECVAVNRVGDIVTMCGLEQLKQKGINVLVVWT